jgi:CDP-4-dehydro-6-deoxyglucose reductase
MPFTGFAEGMTHTIRILPSGHEFSTEGRGSVLQAGLLEGLNLDHTCATGSCGKCRARLLQGELEGLRPYDFRLSEADRNAGWFLMCCHSAASDLLIEAHESGIAADIPEQRIAGRVARLQMLQDQVMQLSIRTPRSRGLQFLAGQGITLHIDGMRPIHLSIASCPCDPIQLRFHVRRRPGEPFSDLLFERLKKGREVVISGPRGDFTLQEESQRPLVFVAWETGFAPVASLIEHVIQKDAEREIHLYWLSQYPQGHYQANQCRAWVDALERFYFHPVQLQPVGEGTFSSTFRQIAQHHAPLADWDLYLAIPVTEHYQAGRLLLEAGLPAEQLKVALMQQP